MKNIFIALTLIIFAACGQSAKEKAAIEKAKMDSIVQATKAIEKIKTDSIINAVKQATKQKEDTKFALQDSIKQMTDYKQRMEIYLSQANGNLAVAQDEMERIKEFQFGRSTYEREQQIKNQTIKIDNMRKGIENTQITIFQAGQKISGFKARQKQYE